MNNRLMDIRSSLQVIADGLHFGLIVLDQQDKDNLRIAKEYINEIENDIERGYHRHVSEIAAESYMRVKQ